MIFVKNTTEAINLVAHSWGRKNIHSGDIILVSKIEHHSNLIPWQIIAQEKNAAVEFIPIDSDGRIDIKAVNVDWQKVKLVSIVHVSNVLGVENDIQAIAKYIRKKTIKNKDSSPKILIDGVLDKKTDLDVIIDEHR